MQAVMQVELYHKNIYNDRPPIFLRLSAFGFTKFFTFMEAGIAFDPR